MTEICHDKMLGQESKAEMKALWAAYMFQKFVN